jgi:hypothetical protein
MRRRFSPIILKSKSINSQKKNVKVSKKGSSKSPRYLYSKRLIRKRTPSRKRSKSKSKSKNRRIRIKRKIRRVRRKSQRKCSQAKIRRIKRSKRPTLNIKSKSLRNQIKR